MTVAARLPAAWTAWPAAAVSMAAVAVLAVGLLAAARAPRAAGPVFAAHTAFALDLLLAAGLIRLSSADGLRALGAVASIVVVRQIISRGIRFGARAAERPGAVGSGGGGS